MELKRILARDTRSAMEQAIQTYGPDVLVISNHQTGGGHRSARGRHAGCAGQRHYNF